VENSLLAPLVARLPVWVIDALLGAALAVALIAGRVLEANPRHALDRTALAGYALCVLAALALSGRRRWSLVVFAVTLVVAVVVITLVPPAGPSRCLW
jgi:hypothetical protein